MAQPQTDKHASGPRFISADEVESHSGRDGRSYWCVIDSFVVDASEFLNSHPGGLRKLMSANGSGAGATGQPFSFSFSRGRNAHFPETGKRFHDGVKSYLAGGSGKVDFSPHGELMILGRLSEE